MIQQQNFQVIADRLIQIEKEEATSPPPKKKNHKSVYILDDKIHNP